MNSDDGSCLECYWYPGGGYCNVHGRVKSIGWCLDYLNDKSHYRLVQEKLKSDREWCERNWRFLDTVDRNKFFKLYGKPILWK